MISTFSFIRLSHNIYPISNIPSPTPQPLPPPPWCPLPQAADFTPGGASFEQIIDLAQTKLTDNVMDGSQPSPIIAFQQNNNRNSQDSSSPVPGNYKESVVDSFP